MPVSRRTLVSVLCIVTAVSTASYAVASSCDPILTHGLRNIQVSKSSEAAIATKFFNHCQKDFNSLSESSLASAEVEIFGQGAGGGNYSQNSRKERLVEWCTQNRDLAVSNRTAYSESQVFYQGAVSAWEKCNALNSKDIRISPVITPDAKTVSIGIVYAGNTTSGVLFYGIKAEGFSCEVSGPGGDKLKLPKEIRSQNIHVSCTRGNPQKKVLNTQEYLVLPRGTIEVQTASDPFQLYFAEEWDPGLPAREASSIRGLVKQAELPVGTIVFSVLTPEQFMSPTNPQYSLGKWVLADGKDLPQATLYERITGKRVAPDMRVDQSSLNILDIISVKKNHGENVVSAVTDLGKQGEWKWFLSGRDIQGQRYNNDYEQDIDHFQSYIDGNGVIISQGQTLNWKHTAWGPWKAGEANLFGISVTKKQYYYYVKIN